jgi:sugar-specific transcriptional regulator TrmB
MKTGEKIVAYCTKPHTAQEISNHCKIQRSSIYSALGRLQMKGLVKRVDTEPATYIVSTPTVVEHFENLAISRAHNPFGLQT